MNDLLTAIVDDDRKTVESLLKADEGLATRLIARPKLYRSGIFHWIYAADTALHLAEAVRARREIIQEFLSRGVSPDVKSGSGRTVRDCARSGWIREMLA